MNAPRGRISARRISLPLIVLLLVSAGALLLYSRATQPPPSAHYAFGHGSTIVLVHGLGSRIGHWLPTARILARHHRVVLVELPGHGESAMPEPFSLEQAEASLDRALAEEGGGPVVLVGHSVGGLVCAAEAMDHPGRVRSLVLVEAPLRQDLSDSERSNLLRSLDQNYGEMIRQAYESFGRDSAQGHALWLEASQLDSINMRRWVRMALTTDLAPRGGSLHMPVLAVMAERSWAIGQPWPAARDAMGYQRIPNLTPLRIEHCGHFIMLDRPEDLAEAIERFAAGSVEKAIAAR
ncbi:MAG TPA: alpha/beta fold hydrolase [Candidatus Udaeobacter sp.]|nr:alpha/beta fold hydrolase [Candidatus Udaeobacter sp.]